MQLQNVFDTDDETGFIYRWFLRKRDAILTDNIVFYLHYHVSTALFLIGCLIVTVGMFIMDPIDCITDTAVDDVIDNYCLYHSTYTLATGDIKESLVSHPGIAATATHSSENAKFHNYYLWVAVMLVIQGVSFYIPRGIWKSWGGSVVANLLETKDKAFPQVNQENMNSNSEKTLDADEKHTIGATGFQQAQTENFDDDDISPVNFHRLLLYIQSKSHRFYYLKLLICEFLNLVNVFVQLLIMNKFLGFSLSKENFWYNENILQLFHEARPFHKNQNVEQMFPKISACTFYSYGPSGNVINYQAICVLPVNAINEKIYASLYVWLLFLILMSALAVLYRLVILVPPVRKSLLKLYMRDDQLDSIDMRNLKNLKTGNWQLLLQLTGNSNIDAWELATIVKGLCIESCKYDKSRKNV